jgi:hypothetical protein
MSVPLTIRIITPDGRLFSGTQVTLDDLERFRDLQGVSQGHWSYDVRGETQLPVVTGLETPIEEGVITNVKGRRGAFRITGDENIESQSGRPLVTGLATAGGTQAFQFDLFRVGRFTASVRSRVGGLGTGEWRGSLRLKDPDGTIVSRTDIITPPVSRKQMRGGSIDYQDLTGMLARMLGRNR